MADGDFISDLINIPSLGGKKCGLDDFFLFRLGIRRGQLDLLSYIFLKELLRAEKIIFIILFQNIQARFIRQGFDMHGRGVNLCRHIHEFQFKCPGVEIHEPGIFDQADIGIVDGDRDILLVFKGAGQGRSVTDLDGKNE